eukprot:365558-Chlamydomonas_euryale.AAC.13
MPSSLHGQAACCAPAPALLAAAASQPLCHVAVRPGTRVSSRACPLMRPACQLPAVRSRTRGSAAAPPRVVRCGLAGRASASVYPRTCRQPAWRPPLRRRKTRPCVRVLIVYALLAHHTWSHKHTYMHMHAHT